MSENNDNKQQGQRSDGAVEGKAPADGERTARSGNGRHGGSNGRNGRGGNNHRRSGGNRGRNGSGSGSAGERKAQDAGDERRAQDERSAAKGATGDQKRNGSTDGVGQQRRQGRNGQQRNGNSKRRREPEVPNKGEHILFVGFMGCGKSSVSRVLAKRCGLPLIDIDKHIEKQEGRKIKEIFAEEGEEGFRRIETMTLASLAFEPKSIISCGGGIVGSPVNRAIVKALGNVIYLKVPCDEAVNRISDPTTRPMLSGPRPVHEIYEERLPLYRDVADITINTSGKSVGANVQQVIGALRRRGLL